MRTLSSTDCSQSWCQDVRESPQWDLRECLFSGLKSTPILLLQGSYEAVPVEVRAGNIVDLRRKVRNHPALDEVQGKADLFRTRAGKHVIDSVQVGLIDLVEVLRIGWAQSEQFTFVEPADEAATRRTLPSPAKRRAEPAKWYVNPDSFKVSAAEVMRSLGVSRRTVFCYGGRRDG